MKQDIKEKILLFIPGYNCEKQIVRVLKQLDGEIVGFIDGIIFVNNRSTDMTERVVLNFKPKTKIPKIHVLRNDKNYSLGGSHKVAFDYAIKNGYDYVIVLHGDDQGDIHDLLPELRKRNYVKYDAMLGARFMKDSKLKGYSKFRTFGNRVYNDLFSVVVRKHIYDLGSGLNMYKVGSLKSKYYYRFPDKLTFNYYMVLAIHYYRQKIKFFPISWREDDQVSNVKLMSQAFNVLGVLGKYALNHSMITKELRDEVIDEYAYKEIKHAKE